MNNTSSKFEEYEGETALFSFLEVEKNDGEKFF